MSADTERLAALLREWFGDDAPIKLPGYLPNMAAWLTARGVTARASTDTRVVKCPVCDGQGLVSKPPYLAGDQQTWGDSSCAPYPCKRCGGIGTLEVGAASPAGGGPTPPIYVYHGPHEGFRAIAFPEISLPVVLRHGDTVELRWGASGARATGEP